MSHLEREIVDLVARPVEELPDTAESAFVRFRTALEHGTVRAAERSDDGAWRVNTWVKQGLLLGFRLGRLTDMTSGQFPFFDRHTYPPRPLEMRDNIRVVPGGSAIRSGAYVAPGVVCMPPMYVNVGAYVDGGTMIDSHALIGSCAQVGCNVHVSAAVQIGGVLEPAGALPVIIEDDAFLGGGSGIYEGCIVGQRAVVAPGVILTGSTSIYDLPNSTIIRRTSGGPLIVPDGAVVVPGTRPVEQGWGEAHGLSLYAPVIIKYRDEGTDASTALEMDLR